MWILAFIYAVMFMLLEVISDSKSGDRMQDNQAFFN